MIFINDFANCRFGDKPIHQHLRLLPRGLQLFVDAGREHVGADVVGPRGLPRALPDNEQRDAKDQGDDGEDDHDASYLLGARRTLLKPGWGVKQAARCGCVRHRQSGQ